MGTVTLGVSIAVPEPYGSLLQERRAGFGDPAAHGIPTHVTLLPPTEVDPGALPAFRQHLAGVAAAGHPFCMRLGGTGTFRPLSPVVYVKLAEGIPECGDLQEQIRSGPVQRELQFPYHPHVTIAHGIEDEAMDRAYEELADYAASWTVSGFALYEQGEDGHWRMVDEYPFGETSAPGVPAQTAPLDAPATHSLRP
ncbi:2'-5' RNA ligase family protein [Streptomyces sp. 8N706]|uniref:2'-5' RNA ligase family protein n=1 Tax=Streptomyces sp. 8N706 TaxID=3457416 RepID=UPI003FD510B8